MTEIRSNIYQSFRLCRSLGRKVYTRSKNLARRFDRSLVRIDQDKISEALEKLGSLASDTLFMHSSLSTLGYIVGGSKAVVDGVHQWIGEKTLVMPTHTYCYPDEEGYVPAFDVSSTPSQVGAITEYFRHLPEAIRSIHPTHSIASIGPDSEEICWGHENCSTPCGFGTPYDRLIKKNCSVLMFGVSMKTYTLFYTAMAAAELPYLYEPEPYELRVKDRVGAGKIVMMWRQNIKIPNRFALMDNWLEQRGLLIRQKLGMGELLFIPRAGDVHRLIVKELQDNPLFLVDEVAHAEVIKNFSL